MNHDSDDVSRPELFADIDIFLKNVPIEDIDISLHNDDFQSVSMKLPVDNTFDVEEFLDNLHQRNQNKFYVITTFVSFLDSPELKKYYVPFARLNEFLYFVNDPEYNEEIVSIVQAEEDL